MHQLYKYSELRVQFHIIPCACTRHIRTRTRAQRAAKIQPYSRASILMNNTPSKPRQYLTYSRSPSHTHGALCQNSFLFTAIRLRKYESVVAAVQIQANDG